MAGADWIPVVRRVLEAAGLAQPETLQHVPEGIGTDVFLAGDAVVRLGTGSDAANFPRTVAVLEAARRTVAVPEVLFSDFSLESFPVRVMVLSFVPGEPMSKLWPKLTDDDRVDLLGQVTQQLARLHRLDPAAVPGAGFASPWWSERVGRIERLLPMARARDDYPRDWVEHMAAYLDEHRDALVSAPPACVLHNDVNWGNVIVHDGRLAALIDFDDALSGPPEEDGWQLVYRSGECEPVVPLERLRELRGLGLGAPGMLERLKLSEIQAALDLLSGELSWVDDATGLAEAKETYETAFLSTFFEDRLAQWL
jgi:aminoglycoside phosphotransferase (APT) family kinase protein